MSVLSTLAAHSAAPKGILDVPWHSQAETEADESVRAHIGCDWLVRVYAPTFLDLVPNLKTLAAAIRGGVRVLRDGAVIELELIGNAQDAAGAARDAAWNTIRDAVQYTTLGAAWDAALGATRDAVRDAARDTALIAVWDAVREAVRDAARAAIRDAAWGAAWDAALVVAWNGAWSAARSAARAAAARDALRPAVDRCRSSYPYLLGAVATASWYSDQDQQILSDLYPGDNVLLRLWFAGPEAARHAMDRARIAWTRAGRGTDY